MFKDILAKSYEEYPKEIDFPQLTLDYTVFDTNAEHEATFSKPIPTNLLDKLADNKENEYTNNNLTSPSTKHRNGFFYQLLTLYQHKAAANLQINKLTKEIAIEKVTTNIISTDFLARIITYYDLTLTQQPPYSQLTKFYKEHAYTEAEKIITSKYNLNFQILSLIEDSLFLNDSSFQ